MTQYECIPGTNLRKIRDFKTPSFVKRYPGNPVLSADAVPYASTNTHNCGVIPFGEGYVMLFRNDARASRENPNDCVYSSGIADSLDGYTWTVRDHPAIKDIDPRITRIGDTYYINCVAGNGASTWITRDFESFDRLERTLPGTRNQVLFPEKINGKYYRLERPMWQPNMPLINAGQAPGGWIGPPWDIWITESPDLKYWGQAELLLETKQLDYANAKIGAGAPPVKTEEGWLCLIHGDDIDPRRGKNGWEPQWHGRYHTGVMLLDLEDPRKVLAYSKTPLLTPEAPYEIAEGYRNNVVFTTSVLLNNDGTIMLYYGAADTYVCIATAKLADVLDFCLGSV